MKKRIWLPVTGFSVGSLCAGLALWFGINALPQYRRWANLFLNERFTTLIYFGITCILLSLLYLFFYRPIHTGPHRLTSAITALDALFAGSLFCLFLITVSFYRNDGLPVDLVEIFRSLWFLYLLLLIPLIVLTVLYWLQRRKNLNAKMIVFDALSFLCMLPLCFIATLRAVTVIAFGW